MTRSTLLRRLLPFAAALAVGLGGAWLGLAAGATESTSMGPFRVQLDAAFGRGVTDIALPPLGRITADTHLAPLRLEATLLDINAEALTEAIRRQSPEEIVAQVERDALDRLTPFGLRVLAVATLGALLAGILVFRRDVRRVAVAAATGLLIVGAGQGLAVATFRPAAFLQPRFSGSLAVAPKLFGPLEAVGERIGYFRSELQRVVAGAIRAYTAVQTNPLGRGDEIRVLHVSDLHLSAVGFEFAREVAEGFDVDLVIDTGDVTSFGTPAENLILQYVPGFRRPYVFVRGNHDSPEINDRFREIRRAIVLDGNAAEVAGLWIYGLGDPYFISERGRVPSDEIIGEIVRSAGPPMLEDVRALGVAPDIVAVHDDRMAETVAGEVPLVVSGHFHENTARVVDGTLFLRVGSTGGASPIAFTAEGDVPISAQILYFQPGTGGERPTLLAWDVIEQDPATASLTVKRHVAFAEFGELVLTPAATTTPTP